MSNTSVSGMLQVTLLTTVVSDREAILLLVILGLHVSVGMMCGSWGDRSQNAPFVSLLPEYDCFTRKTLCAMLWEG